ncbi:MAG: hypothetical protein IKW78_05980 [Prevotella sp.]|nr:hypothetical protein [Prevotella sp.]MBR6016456.1 hypothetical protein [Prevotella sp.]
MKRLQYIRPEIEVTPYREPLMVIGGSAGTGDAFGKEFDFGNNYSDFMSSYERGKEIGPLKDE